jgi:hypothetical protein
VKAYGLEAGVVLLGKIGSTCEKSMSGKSGVTEERGEPVSQGLEEFSVSFGKHVLGKTGEAVMLGNGGSDTLPVGVGFHRNALLDQPVKGEARRLTSAPERARDYQGDLLSQRMVL